MIEINRGKSKYIFRQNPLQPRLIDWRHNRHGARWQPLTSFATEEQARAELLRLERNYLPPTECHQ